MAAFQPSSQTGRTALNASKSSMAMMRRYGEAIKTVGGHRKISLSDQEICLELIALWLTSIDRITDRRGRRIRSCRRRRGRSVSIPNRDRRRG